MKKNKQMQQFIRYFFILLLLLLGTIVIVRNAWISDDAYITFRTVDNFVNGYGLTWNVDERVQAYTNPFWMLLMSAVYSITHEMFFTGIYTSIAVSVCALLLFAVKIAKTWHTAFAGIAVLCFSKSFIDYTTSGLENPLVFLLMAVFFAIYFRGTFTLKTLFFLSLTASLAAFTRMDTILFFFPCLVHAYGETRKWIKGILIGCAGFLPFFIWTGFSLFYYGFPFPNTAYAKLNTGIHDLDLAIQGIRFFQDSYNMDPITLIVCGMSIFSYCLTKKKRTIAVSFGLLLYLLYVVKIGGDFMSGRFFAVPVFCAVINICAVPPEVSKVIWAPALCFSFFIGLQNPYSPVFSDKEYINLKMSPDGIADERGFYYPCSGFLPGLKRKNMPFCEWALEGRRLKKSGIKVTIHNYIGVLGFFSGPDVHVIDTHALADPLLSKLNIIDPNSWRIGHFRRNIPGGYQQTIVTGKNVLTDKRLAEYYSKLSLIIKGDLFNRDRIKEIININMGRYDHLLSGYRNNLIRVHENQIQDKKPTGTQWDKSGNFFFTRQGIHISLKKTAHAPRIEVSLRPGTGYRITYFRGFFHTGTQELLPLKSIDSGLVYYTIDVPLEIVNMGYTSLRILPVRGESSVPGDPALDSASGQDTFSIGHMRVFEDVEASPIKNNNWTSTIVEVVNTIVQE